MYLLQNKNCLKILPFYFKRFTRVSEPFLVLYSLATAFYVGLVQSCIVITSPEEQVRRVSDDN